MKVVAYRIVQTRFASNAFDGEGARLYGGRWNSVGVRMVYVASSLSLATLELLVHTDEIATIFGRYTVIPVEFDSSLVTALPPTSYPRGWNNPVPIAATQAIGDAWIKKQETAVFKVPSAVVETECNYLLNSVHPDFAKIAICTGFVFKPDARLHAALR